ncbi:hypothetical protein [Methylobacter sp.]|uniref:hypothetical protein n=1 Tax=Methylobacter sp. TaxID=2051955 RepID=UPI002FDE7AFE
MNKVVDLSVVSDSALHYSPIDMLRDAIVDIENNNGAYQGKKAFFIIVDDQGDGYSFAWKMSGMRKHEAIGVLGVAKTRLAADLAGL